MKQADKRRSGGLVLIGICFLIIATGRSVYAAISTPAPERSANQTLRTPQQTSSGYGRPTRLGSLEDPSITESSGLVASRLNRGLFWTHNDSGNYEPYLYCLREDGASCGRWSLGGVDPYDWEDIAAGPGSVEGVDYLYLGDIGDNARSRSSVTVHVVPEPIVEDGRVGGTLGKMTAIELSYPDGPHDAETLLVHPSSGDLYIVTKESSSRSLVFKAEAPLFAQMELAKVSSFRIFDNLSARTGGDISSDGKKVVFSTYLGAYEKRASSGDFDDVWKAPSTRIDIGSANLREGIAYSVGGRTILSTSEGIGTNLTAVAGR